MNYIKIIFEDNDQVAYQCVLDGVVQMLRDENGDQVSDEGRASHVIDDNPPLPGWANA